MNPCLWIQQATLVKPDRRSRFRKMLHPRTVLKQRVRCAGRLSLIYVKLYACAHQTFYFVDRRGLGR
jgi:hypothetical protein